MSKTDIYKFYLTPKNLLPFQRVPVISFAIADRLLYTLPLKQYPFLTTMTSYFLPWNSLMNFVPELYLAGALLSGFMLCFLSY